ncbi:lipopolysaccharide biosynthesis protein [Blastococcus xanthinilyticus]|uniref:O-antigen/teichoic acid export membrane protein n=1 Tax=Blastococcus xanthinilyticus TaxID=1564164 RepID=A0A5S5D1F0_9ACTN|nr:hypothetical protein [Blastococcus xanthinilyticus]TYP89863.1 O-antigen/teichoic acid export membrane protein [Blastococcus xanthinilyticus]
MQRSQAGAAGAGDPAPAVRGAAPALGWVALCIVGSGVLTYVYLALVARAVPTADYGWFGSYWSLALLVGFGAFLPVELELARLLHRRPPGARLPRGTVATLALLAACGAVALLAAAGELVPSLGGHVGFLLALLAVCALSAGQFLLRGLLLGADRLGTHGTVLLLDSGVRVVLAVLLTVFVPSADGAAYAWTLVGGMALAHLPLLAWVLVRRRRSAPPPVPPEEDPPARAFAGAVGHLLVGSLCAQALLNAAPILATALAAEGQAQVAARFIASYTLVRLPLFVAVPLQSALIPVLTRLQATPGGDAALRRLAVRGLAAVTVLAGVAALAGYLLGPWVVALVFGERYALTGPEIGLLAAGGVLHLGLLVGSQALVASGRHRAVATVWAGGLAVAGVLIVLVPDLVLRLASAFTVGSGVGLLLTVLFLVHATRATAAPAAEPAVPTPGSAR